MKIRNFWVGTVKKKHLVSQNTILQPAQGWVYDAKMFRDAMSKKEQCKVKLQSDWGENPKFEKWIKNLEENEKKYHEYCPKSKSNNIIFCPTKLIKKRNDEKVQWINDYFKNFRKKNKKKKKYERKKKNASAKSDYATINRINRMTLESTELAEGSIKLANSANSEKSTESAETAETAESAESAESAKSAESTESAKSAASAESSKSAESAESAKSAKSAKIAIIKK